ncbi:MAG TPA: type II secretion system protein [Candidatus Paceibacterota bacterium]|nr:type II secretion system protein [Candidatus Paceibacterota bacterium]
MNIRTKNSGFTLVEILVSLAVFAIVITAGASSVLSIIDANQKAQSLNSVMTNMYTALEGMAREVRVGTNYTHQTGDSAPFDTLKFTSDIGVENIFALSETNGIGTITQSVGPAGIAQPITSSEIDIESLTFTIYPLDTGGSINDQPMVVMNIRGRAETQAKTKTEFNMQTIMSQRLLQEL